MLPTMLQCMAGIKESFQTLEDNPRDPQVTADEQLFLEVEEFAKQLGANSVGYTKLPSRWVFQDKAVAYQNVIMLSMEMDKEGIDSAPSPACMKTVMDTYRDLGRITNQIAEMLRSRGYGAQAGHPLNGVALYPPLAQMAGLGWMGLNGIIITPEHGPRVRLAAVFTSIKNLPVGGENRHSWVADFCQECRSCVKKCPPNALLGEAVDHGNGQFTYVESSRCFPYFNEYHGCSVCIAVCPFNHTPYQKIKESFLD
jgi:NAD-dependent dihydropyrimidine dehydrogenase PreA subunit